MNSREIFQSACLQDIGSRREQQDRVVILRSDGAHVLVLADGMSGQIRGAFAAQTAINEARLAFEASSYAEPSELLKAIVASANKKIISAATMADCPAATCVLVHLTPLKATWTHLGDSRLYRFRDGQYVERTLDHNKMELLRKKAVLTEEEIQAHPKRNWMYACLGAWHWQPPTLEIRSAEIAVGDGFLLCSDGFWNNVGIREMESVFHGGNFAGKLRKLVRVARARGETNCDNISVAAIRRTQGDDE